MFLQFVGIKISLQFYVAIKYSLQSSSVLYRKKWQISMILIEVITLRNMLILFPYYWQHS